MRKILRGLVPLAFLLNAPMTFGAERTITLVNIEFEGTKVWVPGTIVVEKGDTVKIKLINNVQSDPNQHGFSIPEFKVAAVVDRGEPKTVEFVADKAGIFATTCQLHPAHIGGQLVVLEK
jgi:nitrosocyanin